MGIKFSEDFYSRTFNFAIFFTIKEREIEDPSKISTSKIFVPVSSNKVFVQEWKDQARKYKILDIKPKSRSSYKDLE